MKHHPAETVKLKHFWLGKALQKFVYYGYWMKLIKIKFVDLSLKYFIEEKVNITIDSTKIQHFQFSATLIQILSFLLKDILFYV